jgi:glutamate N-acetyltransferase/amino-acid N-acetyltransferase
MLRRAVAESFNRISVDGDTSTNDALTLSATGAAGGEPIAGPEDPRFAALAEAVTAVCRDLAHAVVRDGEGATRFITISVTGAAEAAEADAIADRIARSPLVKTACFAGDPNWGRILMAAGAGAPAELDWSTVDLSLNGVRVVTGGQVDPGYTEAAGQAAMADEALTIALELGRGSGAGHKWTCDFSYDYVRINADYRS